MTGSAEHPLLRVRGLSKRYGHIHALRDASLEVLAGEVMGLVGENGAGKSTLVKILSGIVRPDTGTIEIGGQSNRRDLGAIAVVQQELSLVESMSIAENVFLGRPRGSWIRSARRQANQARDVLELVGLGDVDPHTEVGHISVAERQLVEIARMVARDARILILDEPTAALAEAEIERIGEIVKALARDGRAVIYVTHHLDEIFALCDRVTVFRDGRSQPPRSVGELTVDELIQHMLGRPLARMFPQQSGTAAAEGEAALAVHALRTAGLGAPVSLTVARGEILGLAGQMGSGASALLRAVAGAQPIHAGEVSVAGRPLVNPTTRRAMKAGLAYCSNDRKADGVFATRSVAENLTAPAIRAVTPGGWRVRARERRLAAALAERFQISRRRLRSRANTLSGGNQQKVAVAKLVGIRPSVLLIDEPTRGVDVGARAEIYEHLRALARDGMAIVFTSSDTLEVLGLADRVGTFYRGCLVATYDRDAIAAEVVTRDITHPRPAAAVEVVS